MPLQSTLAILGVATSGALKLTVTSFDAFVHQHQRSYTSNAEYEQRRALFESRSDEARAHNSNPNRLWTAGVNKLSDWTDGELQRLRGWDGSVHPGQSSSSQKSAFLQSTKHNNDNFDSDDASDLPEEKSWETLQTAQHIHNQGGCGSCWAIASSTVLEYHTEIHTAKRRTFSAQQIVSCTPNPRDCGGNGKCQGATAELAMDWVLKNGCAEEAQVPYMGEDGECSAPAAPKPSFLMGSPSAGGNAFGMTGWEMLPKNKHEPLMRALVEKGPAAVSVGAAPWNSYESGVFDGCGKDSIIDHAVTLIAYGKDPVSNAKFWQIQNSWGNDWGEFGRIRLLRHNNPSDYCGMDNKPQLGTACKGENDPVPVCGMCGVLFDSVVPHFG